MSKLKFCVVTDLIRVVEGILALAEVDLGVQKDESGIHPRGIIRGEYNTVREACHTLTDLFQYNLHLLQDNGYLKWHTESGKITIEDIQFSIVPLLSNLKTLERMTAQEKEENRWQ